MVYSIKSELRKDYIFLRKVFIFYLIISQTIINCTIKIYPDHYSEDDPNFSTSQINGITNQQFYYDLGYFTEKTEKYRSPKYGINYRPVKCQKIEETDDDPEYNSDDTTSFFGQNKGIKDPYSTLDLNNKFDDTKLFRNTIKGKSISCPSPIRAFHNNSFEINFTIPMISEFEQDVEMILTSNDGEINNVIRTVSLKPNIYEKVHFLIIPEEQTNLTTKMYFMKDREDVVTPVTIYGDPELNIHFVGSQDFVLSNYRVIVNDSTTITGEKYNTSMIRSKNGLHNCTKDLDCFIGFQCTDFECKPCHSTCTECNQDDTNAAGMNHCKECNVLSNLIYPQDGYCTIGYPDLTLFKDFEVNVKPDGQEFDDRETLGFWIFFSNTAMSRKERTEGFEEELENGDIIQHVVLKNRLVISMIQKVDNVQVYCHVYENIFAKNTSDIVYYRHDDPIKRDFQPLSARSVRGFYPHKDYHLHFKIPSDEQKQYMAPEEHSIPIIKTIDGHWVHISCAESFDHGLYYLKTVINGKIKYEEEHLTGEPFFRKFENDEFTENVVVNDKYFKPIINDDSYLFLRFHNFNYSESKIYMRHLTLFKEYIPVKMQYMYFDYSGVSDFYELLYYLPFTNLIYGNEYKIKGYSYGNVEEEIKLELNNTNSAIVGDLSPALNFKHLNLPKMNHKYKEIDLVAGEIEALIKDDSMKYVYDDNLALCCNKYLNHDINECKDTCVDFRRLPYEGVHKESGYCDYTCSDSMSCLTDHLSGDDLDQDKEFCTSLSKAYNLFFRCEDDQIDYYLQFSGFYNSSKLEKKFAKMKSYLIDFWYYDDYLLKESGEKFFGDPSEEKHFVFHSNVVDLYFKIETDKLYNLKTKTNVFKYVGSHYNGDIRDKDTHNIFYAFKGFEGDANYIPFNYMDWNRVFISAYYNRTDEITQFRICLNYYNADLWDDERGRCGGLTMYQQSLAELEEIIFCHGVCKDWEGKTMHWATGYYKNLRIWDGNNVSPTILTQYDIYYPDYINRVSSIKYFFPLKNRYISNNKIIDPKNREYFTVKKGNYNLKKYNFSSKFDLIAVQRLEGKCYLMDHISVDKQNIYGRELLDLIDCTSVGCERCWCTRNHRDRCYKCKVGYYLDTEFYCQPIGAYYFKSPNLLNSDLDAKVSKITLIENKEAVTVTFWFKTFGFSGDDQITMFKIGDNLDVVFASTDNSEIKPYGLSIVNDNRLVSNVFDFRKKIGSWQYFSLAYHREMSDFGVNYFPVMMQFELGLDIYEVNITNVMKDMSLDSFTIKKEYWGLFTDLKFYNNYILSSYGFEKKLQESLYKTPFYIPVPVASFFTHSGENNQCFDTSYLIGANINDFECVPAEGPTHNYGGIDFCNKHKLPSLSLAQFHSNKACINECYRIGNITNTCSCYAKNFNSQMIYKNGNKNICRAMDYINFANSEKIVIEKVKTAKLTKRYTMQFWMFAYNYISGRFGGIEFYWDGHSKILVEKGSQSIGDNLYEFHCIPYLNEDGSIPRKLTTTIEINKWNFLSCAVDFVEINYYINVNTYFHELYLKRANLIQTTPTELLETQDYTTLTIQDNTKFQDWGLLFFRNIRLWNWCYFNAEFLSRLTIKTYSKFPYLIEQWNPNHPLKTAYQNEDAEIYFKSFIVNGINNQNSFEVKFNQKYGMNVLDEYFYRNITICNEDGEYYDVAREKCLQFVDISKMNDFTYDPVPISFSGSYSMSIWIFLEDASVISQGIHINWSKHLQITIIRTTRLEAYCFPQGYYSDSVSNDNIQYKYSSALNVGQVYLVDEQTSESAVWINVICAMSHYNKRYYVNGMDEKTLIEKTLNNEVLYKDSSGNTINSYNPMRYYFGNITNYRLNSHLSLINIKSTKRIYFRSITLFRDYIPYWYNKILRNMNLDNLEKGRMPSVVLFSNYVNYTLNNHQLTYMIQYQKEENTKDYEMDKQYRKLTPVGGSTFELCTNFRFMPLCEFATRVKMKYDPDKNYCVFISQCDLTDLNAFYCMEENTPLSCLPNYYITADDGGQIYCSGYCIKDQIRHPGNNQTQGICNSLCDKGTKQCPGTSSSFLNDYPTNYKCNENNYRIGYHCLNSQQNLQSALFFSKCYNSPNFYKTLDYETEYKYRYGYVLEFWMKLDKALDTCQDGYSTKSKEYYFKTNIHSIYKDTVNNIYYYELGKESDGIYKEIAGVQEYEWNKFYIRTKITDKIIDLFLNFDITNAKVTIQREIKPTMKLSLNQISFCSRDTNGACGIHSGINWGSAYYKNIRVWDDRTATLKMIQDFNNDLFEEFPDSLILYYPLRIQFMDLNVIQEIREGESFYVTHIQNPSLQSTDENIYYNYEINHDWGNENPGYYISAIGESEDDQGVITVTSCHPACKRCYSSTATNCYECNEGYVLNGMECIRINGYYLKIPAKTLNTIIPFKIETSSVKVKELSAWTFCIYMKFEGIVAQKSSQPIIIQFKSDTYLAYDVETTNLIFTVGSLEAFRDTNFNQYFGIWVPICVANYISGAVLNEIYPNMFTLNVNKIDIPFNSDYKIPNEGVKIDQISFHYQVIAFFADFRIYDRFIQGNFGTIISSTSASEHLLIYYSLNGNNACIQADYLTTSDIIQVDCVPDYNIYVDDSRKCVDETYYFDTKFSSENIPCASCDNTCVTKCFSGSKQQCTCDMADGLYWLRKHKTSYQTYCEYLPFIDFSAVEDVEMYVPSSNTYESTLEVWFFAYSYNLETFNFKEMTINWNLHNKIVIYTQGTKLKAKCYALSDNSREGFYTEYLEEEIYGYKWNLLRCGSEFISNKHKYFFNRLDEEDLVIQEYPDRLGKITTLKISNIETSYDSYGFVFLRELKLWQQYNRRYIETSYIDLQSFGVYAKENKKSYGIFPGLIAYYKNDFKISDYQAELNPPHRYTIINLLGGESNVEVFLVNKWSTMRRGNFIGYNIVDPTNEGNYKDLTLCEEGEVYNESSDTCSKPLTTHCDIPANIGDDCATCSEETIYINPKDGSCTNICPDGTYARDDINQCRECHYTCYTCFGPFYNNCLSCTGNYSLVPELHVCIDFCEDYNLTMSPDDHNMCIEFSAGAELTYYEEGIPIDKENFVELEARITHVNSINNRTVWEFDENKTREVNNDYNMTFGEGPFDPEGEHADVTELLTSVKPDFFQLGKKYVFNLKICADNIRDSTKTLCITVPFVLTINSSPFNGEFRIAPVTGLYNTTTFLIHCDNYDDDTTKDLLYAFYYKEKGTKGGKKLLRGFSREDEVTSNFTVEYYALPNSTITITCYVRDNYGATTTVEKDIIVANNIKDGIYDLKEALVNYRLPTLRTDVIYYHRSQYLMSLGIDKYKILQPNLYQSKYKPSIDKSMITKTDPGCTLDYCNENGYCDLMDEFINCHCETGYIGRNCHVDKNGYEDLLYHYNDLYNKLIGDLKENITYFEFETFHNLYFGACQFILDNDFFKVNLDTFLTLAMTNYKYSILNNTAEYFDFLEYYYSYKLTLMEQERGKIKYITGLKVRNITLDEESMADYKESFDYINEELIKLMKYIANEYISEKKSFYYESKNFYLALTPVESDFDEINFFKDRKTNYHSQAEFMKCVNYIEVERLRNPNYYLYLFFIEYYNSPFAYNNTLLKNNTGPVIELKLFDTKTGKFLGISDCNGENRIKFIIPYSGYYYLEEFNSQKYLYDPNQYKSPDDEIFEDPIYIMKNGNVTGITVEELKKLYYRRMNITPRYYDELLNEYTDTGINYINFTSDTNFLIFSSSHLTQFAAFFVANNATFKTNNRFFYLKRPRILKFVPNYFKSWGVFLFLCLLLYYIIFLCIFSIYDLKTRKREALLEYIKSEVVEYYLHYIKNEDKNNFIPNIFRNKYNFRNFEEMRENNKDRDKIDKAITTNEDLKSTQNFWNTDNKKGVGTEQNFDGDVLDDFNVEQDVLDINNNKKVRSNFFYQGDIRQKKLTVEQKLRKRNIYNLRNRNNILKSIKQNKRRNLTRAEIDHENQDEVKSQQLEDFASIDLTFFEFLKINIVSRSLLINSFVIVSIFSPRWKKQSLLLTEMCINIILLSVFLTSDENVTSISNIAQIVVYSIVCMLISDFIMYIISFFFFSFPFKIQRKLFNLVTGNHQLEIIKVWEENESRMKKFEIIGLIFCVLIWLFSFYISFGFTVVWKVQQNAFLITFAFCFLFDFIVAELLIEIFIAILYLDRKHNSFLRFIAEGLNRLRNVRCLSP